jgi:hypothetical protein
LNVTTLKGARRLALPAASALQALSEMGVVDDRKLRSFLGRDRVGGASGSGPPYEGMA